MNIWLHVTKSCAHLQYCFCKLLWWLLCNHQSKHTNRQKKTQSIPYHQSIPWYRLHGTYTIVYNIVYGTAQLQGNECSHVACEFHVCHSRISHMSLACSVFACTQYNSFFYSSFSLQVTSELANSKSKQTTVLGWSVTPSQRWKPNSLKIVYNYVAIAILYNYLCNMLLYASKFNFLQL